MALQSLALRFLLALASLLSAHGQEEFFNIQIVPQGTGKKWFFLLEDFAAFPPVSWISSSLPAALGWSPDGPLGAGSAGAPTVSAPGTGATMQYTLGFCGTDRTGLDVQ